MNVPTVPEELFSKKTLFTLGGSASAVWLVLLVIANLDAEHKMVSVTAYKFISLGLSQFFAIYMIVRDRRKKRRENYLFAVLNGLLIFINATGINAITSQMAVPPDDFTEAAAIYTTAEPQPNTAGFLAFSLFRNEVNWFQNPKKAEVYQQIRETNKKLRVVTTQLKEEKQALQITNSELRVEYDQFKTRTTSEISELRIELTAYRTANLQVNPNVRSRLLDTQTNQLQANNLRGTLEELQAENQALKAENTRLKRELASCLENCGR